VKYLILFLTLISSQLTLAEIDFRVDQVAKLSMKKNPSERKWDWEDAVFLYGLSEYGKNHSNPEMKKKIFDYLKAYQEHWLKKGLPEIDRSDACPSALTALTLAEDWGDSSYLANLDPVIYYLKNEPRNSVGTINHLGHSWLRFFYPPSIWVDSLMMVGVLSSRIGTFQNDLAFMEFAARQPGIFTEKLQDPEDKLFRHAWYETSGKVVPKEDAYWLRGNGWVLVATLQILERMPKDHPLYQNNLDILKTLANALIEHQRENGFWGTLINIKKSYDETSGTALVGYALARGYRLGLLDSSALNAARKAYQATLRKIKKTKKGYSLRGISAATNPTPKFIYLLVPKVPDKGYGVGPFLMLASEIESTKEML
jgi:rhamnogalacturonyl hydrolase YesR